jgi:hypothetical protein
MESILQLRAVIYRTIRNFAYTDLDSWSELSPDWTVICDEPSRAMEAT